MRYVTAFQALLAGAALTVAVGCASSPGSADRGGETGGSAVLVDLADAEQVLESQQSQDRQPTRAHRLYQQDGVTMALRHFEQGAVVPDHAVPGTAMAFVLEGQLEITVEGQRHTVSAGQVLVMEPNAMHNVHAVEQSRMLLTIGEQR